MNVVMTNTASRLKRRQAETPSIKVDDTNDDDFFSASKYISRTRKRSRLQVMGIKDESDGEQDWKAKRSRLVMVPVTDLLPSESNHLLSTVLFRGVRDGVLGSELNELTGIYLADGTMGIRWNLLADKANTYS
jgi:hypothetical protein